MTLKPFRRPNLSTNNVLLAMTMSASIILLGCGGGGGGGPQPQPGTCGSAAGSTTTVVCGRVVTAGALANGVQGASVSLLSPSGAVLTSTSTDSTGFYKFPVVPVAATLFKVVANSATYTADFANFNGDLYDYAIQNQAKNGSCVPALGNLINGDNQLSNVQLYSQGTPPPPPSGCPR